MSSEAASVSRIDSFGIVKRSESGEEYWVRVSYLWLVSVTGCGELPEEVRAKANYTPEMAFEDEYSASVMCDEINESCKCSGINLVFSPKAVPTYRRINKQQAENLENGGRLFMEVLN